MRERQEIERDRRVLERARVRARERERAREEIWSYLDNFVTDGQTDFYKSSL